MNNIWILAQAADTEAPSGINSESFTDQDSEAVTVVDSNAAAQSARPQRSPIAQFLPFILIFVVMYLLLFRGPRKKQQKHKQMLQTLQKNDRVRTIGGIIGTVVDIKDQEVTLKVDESNNTRLNPSPS